MQNLIVIHWSGTDNFPIVIQHLLDNAAYSKCFDTECKRATHQRVRSLVGGRMLSILTKTAVAILFVNVTPVGVHLMLHTCFQKRTVKIQ